MRNKKWICSASVIGTLALAGAFAFANAPTASAATAESFKLSEGMSIRTEEPAGLRFLAEMSVTDKANYSKFGIIMLPEAMGDLSLVTINAEEVPSCQNAVVAKANYWLTEESFTGVLVGGDTEGNFANIDSKFYNVPISAMGYAIPEEGEVAYTNVLTRSMSYIAKLADLAESKEEGLLETISNAATVTFSINDDKLIDAGAEVAPVFTIGGIQAAASKKATVTYTSDNEDVAKVVDGKIQAVATGKAKITATVSVENGVETFTQETEVEVCKHVYDNACDADCNDCGGQRTVNDHQYDNACDAICNECDYERTVGDHVFDNANDTDCNVCGTTREIITLTNRQDVDLDLTYADGLVLSTDNVTLDVSEASGIASVTSVSYTEEIATATYADGKITLPKAAFDTAFGEATVIVDAKTNDGSLMLVNVPVLLISKAISNAEELDMWYNLANALDKSIYGVNYPTVSDGYFVLDGNVSYNKVYTAWASWQKLQWCNPMENGFMGTLDGRGYFIDGLDMNTSFGAFVSVLHTEGEIKNVGFTNAKLTGAAAGFLCMWGSGLIENVYVQYAAGTLGAGGGFNGTFFATDGVRGVTENNGLTINDCFVDASLITAQGTSKKSLALGYAIDSKANLPYNCVTMNGVYAKSSNISITGFYDVIEYKADGELCGFLGSDEATLAELATWDKSYWTIVDGEPIPLKVQESIKQIDKPNSSMYYTFTGAESVFVGEDYTFTVTPTNSELTDLIVTVNGVEVSPVSGVYTVSNVQESLVIEVVHAYIEQANGATVTYDKTTGEWKAYKATKASYAGVREHGDAYITKEYIAYMMTQGYTKLQFTIKPDKVYALQALYRYNGKDYVAYGNADREANLEDKTITIDLTVASELEFFGTNERGSGGAIASTDCYLLIYNLVFTK